MMAVGSFAEEAKWRRLFVKDAASQSWKLLFESPDGRRYSSSSLAMELFEQDTESISSSSSSANSMESPSQASNLPRYTFVQMKANILDIRGKLKKRRKCYRLPPEREVPHRPSAIEMRRQVCQLALVDVFQDTPLSTVMCPTCLKSYGYPDHLSIDFDTRRIAIHCGDCGCLSIRVFTSRKVVL